VDSIHNLVLAGGEPFDMAVEKCDGGAFVGVGIAPFEHVEVEVRVLDDADGVAEVDVGVVAALNEIQVAGVRGHYQAAGLWVDLRV